MIDSTPKQKGNGKDWSKGGSPESATSGNTVLTGESDNITCTEGFDRPVPSQTLEKQQEGLPEEIKSKTYLSSNLVAAEDELWKDLKAHSLEDSDHVIEINENGKAIWAMPTLFHQQVVRKLLLKINKCSEEGGRLFTESEHPLLVDKDTGRCKYPDVGIWGASRLAEDEDGDLDLKYLSIDGNPGSDPINPHVIIEFSWTNKIEVEIEKLCLQITDHIKALGAVNLGFLIKAVPVNGKEVPTRFDRSVPLVGFDIYRFRSDETLPLQARGPIQRYRCGTEAAKTMTIEIDGTDLGGRSNPVHIPLASLQHICEKSGLVFQEEATG